jgi:hypothetical protein
LESRAGTNDAQVVVNFSGLELQVLDAEGSVKPGQGVNGG